MTNQTISDSTYNKGYRLAIGINYGAIAYEKEDADRLVYFVLRYTRSMPETGIPVKQFYPINDYCLNDPNKTQAQKDEFRNQTMTDPSKYRCMAEEPLPLRGNGNDPTRDRWLIDVRRCVNTTENNNHCFPNEVIDEKIENRTFLHVIYENNLWIIAIMKTQ
jgi:hypothetical protein